MSIIVADIIRIMESIAPISLAEEWDNVGLQVGQKDWPVRTVWIALDPLPEVVAAACKKDIDLLITHHPLLFQPLSSIDFDTSVGSIIYLASRHKMAIFTAHTNLDNAADGINDVLARRLELKNLKVLKGSGKPENYKLVVYVPVEYEQKVLDAIFETKAGKIGAYTCCSFRNNGQGTFKPGSSSRPLIGKVDEVSQINEIRIETVVKKNDLKSVIEHIREKHPYETMAYDVYPLLSLENRWAEERSGLGRVGEFDGKKELASLALFIKKKLGLKSVKVVGRHSLPVNKAAVCAGSGSSLMSDFFSSGAQVLISGDLRYHDARAIEAADLGLIDIGHFASEHLIVEALAERLNKILSATGVDVKIEACRLEKDPFAIL